MQLREALELRKKWGDKHCNHPHLEKEYDLGAQTGDWVCTTCGRSGWGPDWPHKLEKQAEKTKDND